MFYIYVKLYNDALYDFTLQSKPFCLQQDYDSGRAEAPNKLESFRKEATTFTLSNITL